MRFNAWLCLVLTKYPFCVILSANRQRGRVCPNSEEMEHQLALTRKFLEGMGIEDKQVESIIEAHSETVNGLKADRDKYKEQAAKVPDLQKQLEDANAKSDGSDQWEKKYKDEHKAFEDFRASVDAEKADAAKAQAYRDMLEKAGIDPRRIKSIMRLTDLSKVEMEDGNLKDAEGLEKAAKEEWSDFVMKTQTKTEPPATPPTTNGNAVEGADPEIAKRLQARHERLYGKSAESKEQA